MLKENEPDLDVMSLFSKKLQEVDPDLRNDLIDALRRPKKVVELLDALF